MLDWCMNHSLRYIVIIKMNTFVSSNRKESQIEEREGERNYKGNGEIQLVDTFAANKFPAKFSFSLWHFHFNFRPKWNAIHLRNLFGSGKKEIAFHAVCVQLLFTEHTTQSSVLLACILSMLLLLYLFAIARLERLFNADFCICK